MDRAEIEGLDRESLVVRAERAGIRRARILTRPELIDELLRIDPSADREKVERSRGFFGRARDLLARVVERGLHLPDAADRIRAIGPLPPTVPRADTQAVPTVTLAEIYAAQGHKARAIETLRRVLEREPDHAAARALLVKLEDAAYVAPKPELPPEADVEPDIMADPDRPQPVEPPRDKTTFQRRRADESGANLGDVFAADDAPGGIPVAATEEQPACVAVPIGEGAYYVWWRGVRDAEIVVRVVVVTPTWEGPQREIRDVRVEVASAGLAVRGLPARAVVRIAIGRIDGDAFTPIAHSPAIESDTRRGLQRWTPGGILPLALDDPRIARAVEAARRA
ncbi:MAG TPA: tetratricopeptide repeat protein [Labilithrix sp.]|jgi:hypothetical protein